MEMDGALRSVPLPIGVETSWCELELTGDRRRAPFSAVPSLTKCDRTMSTKDDEVVRQRIGFDPIGFPM